MEYRDYLEDVEVSSQVFSVEEFLREEHQEEEERLEKKLDRIEDLLEERREIHSENVEELESKLDWYIERLEELYRGPGSAQDNQKRELKDKIEEFYSELRRERRNQWRDRIELETELRDVEQSLEELKDEDRLWEMLE